MANRLTGKTVALPEGERLSFAVKAHDWERADAEGGWVRGTMVQQARKLR
jgi:hypothetical protein